MPIPVKKAQLRDSMRARRAAFGRGRETAFGDAIAANFMAAAEDMGLSAGKVIAGYWPIGGEADVRPLLDELSEFGVICALPIIGNPAEPLRFRQWQPDDSLEDAPLGTHQPTPDKPFAQPQYVLTPLVAFDVRGYRLGQGGGYYDRTLAQMGSGAGVVSIGVAYSCQEAASVPHDAHDMRLDWVVTEKAVIRAENE